MVDTQKPYKGRIEQWYKHWLTIGETAYKEPKGYGLGYIIVGKYLDHPRFAMERGHTSYVVEYDPVTGEIETRNSRYTLVGPDMRIDIV